MFANVSLVASEDSKARIGRNSAGPILYVSGPWPGAELSIQMSPAIPPQQRLAFAEQLSMAAQQFHDAVLEELAPGASTPSCAEAKDGHDPDLTAAVPASPVRSA